jgi:polysaccharide pyruvyl transferase WcaK-like protein
MKIGLIDPALYSLGVTSPNIGDQVISRAVHRELRSIFGEATEIIAIPSHQYPSRHSLKLIEGLDHVFVGGSNLLWFRLGLPASWKIGFRGLRHYRDLILFGVGWGAYDIKPNAYGKWVCNLILSKSHMHSVRDSFTREIADRDLQIPKVMQTACPTMWALTEDLLSSIHTQKGDECIFSLTDYSKNPELDKQLIKDLSKQYAGRLIFWPQGAGDLEYCRSLGYTGRIIERSLSSLMQLLSSGSLLDHVGTRLHAGILCLEHRVRSLIISVDNRAKEIAFDTGLPTVAREDREALLRWIEGSDVVRIRLPMNEISRWRQQFRNPVYSAAAA